MNERHDGLDDWLNERVEPMYPPPGTFDLIKRRARRRKYRKLAVTAGSAAVIVAAAVTVPQVVNFNVLSPPSTGLTAGRAASVATRTGGGITESSGASQPSAVPSPSAALTAPVPADFRPTSVTFVGTNTGYVIGQAGTAGHCATAFCTSVARTDNAGDSWTGVPAPVTGPASGGSGVSQIRFLNLADGWAFGPALWATHDGGQNWTRVDTHGLRVTDLETVGDRVFGVFADCSGGGALFADRCTRFTLYSSPASGDDWAPVGAATSGLTGAGRASAVSLTLTETRGFLLAPDGTVYAGGVDGGAAAAAAWRAVGQVPCAAGRAQADGQPAGALLGANDASHLILVCASRATAGGPQKKLVYTSADGGANWHLISVAPEAGAATSVASSPAETVILGTDQGIDLLPAGGTAWQRVALSGAPAGGFSYVGMTTNQQGVALPADPGAGTVWFTFDGGRTWAPSTVSGS
jgi:photosystem II stability/assembly factor-like uncharacterized protein